MTFSDVRIVLQLLLLTLASSQVTTLATIAERGNQLTSLDTSRILATDDSKTKDKEGHDAGKVALGFFIVVGLPCMCCCYCYRRGRKGNQQIAQQQQDPANLQLAATGPIQARQYYTPQVQQATEVQVIQPGSGDVVQQASNVQVIQASNIMAVSAVAVTAQPVVSAAVAHAAPAGAAVAFPVVASSADAVVAAVAVPATANAVPAGARVV